MLDALKTLFENNVISEEIKADIVRAWGQRILENRNEVTKQLREEFANRYEHDKTIMVEAVDSMLNDQLREEIAQFVEDRKQLAQERVKTAKKGKEAASVMKEFVTRQLAKEVKELHEDQKQMELKFKTPENFVVEALAQEIAEFYADKKDIAETKVRLVKEGRQALAKVKQQFIQRAASLVEDTVNTALTTEISQLKEDIESARKHDFGRKIFEAFANEYQNSYLSEKTEAAKLLKVIEKKNQEINEAKNAVLAAKKVLEKKEAQVNALKESKERQTILSELVTPLSKDQRVIMSELLESVQTSKLRSSFEKYLPAVVAGNTTQKKKPLTESREVTGNKPANKSISSSEDHNIFDIRRLAGIKN